MTNTKHGGIAQLEWAPDAPLEERVRLALVNTRTLHQLAEQYADLADQRRVRGRELISSALRAILANVDGKRLTDPDGSIDVLLLGLDPISDLANALREFDHDRARIDMGAKPELVLKPVASESVEYTRTPSASRKMLIRWLVIIQLWDKKVDRQFRTQAGLLEFAAAYAKSTAGRLKAERRKFNKGEALRHDLEFYHDLIDDVTSMARDSTDGHSPFRLLLPGVIALST